MRYRSRNSVVGVVLNTHPKSQAGLTYLDHWDNAGMVLFEVEYKHLITAIAVSAQASRVLFPLIE